MKRRPLLIGLLLGLVGCQPAAPPSPNPNDLAVATRLGWSQDTLKAVRSVSQARLEPLKNDFGALLDEEPTDDLRERLSQALQSHGQRVARWENEGRNRLIIVADTWRAIDLAQTSGRGDEHSYDGIVAWLKALDAKADLDVRGAGQKWIEIEFKAVPADVDNLARDIYAFAPKTVHQGVGTLATLMDEIRNTRRVELLFD